MKIIYATKFQREYRKLSADIRLATEEKEKIFKDNPFDPRLNSHKLKGNLEGFLSFSINQKYRVIFSFKTNNEVHFLSVGDHTIYSLWD